MQATFLSSLLLVSCLAVSAAHALDPKDTLPHQTTGKLSPAQISLPASGHNDTPKSDPAKDPYNGCSHADRLTNKCSPYPSAPLHHHRPIIIVPPAATPPVDVTPTSDDWEGCRKTKLNQLNLTQNGNLQRARQLDEWLWKNCRAYSEDLRQLEQDQM